MFEQLDTAIAFVVVILMLSLFVTAIVQAISALFDLRGKNLTRALSDLFRQMDSGLSAAPASDATLTGVKLWLDRIKDWCVHPFSRVTLARKAADAVAKHPVLAHTFTRAKAIRKDELLKVLKDLCSNAPAGTIDPTVQAKLRQILASQVPGGVATVNTAQALTAQLGTKFPNLKPQLEQVVAETMGSVSQLEVEIDKWFDTVMDRASDVFTRWTRTITVVISILFVGILHIDSGLILGQISTGPEIKAALNKLSDAALSQGGEITKEDGRGSEALKEFVTEHKLAMTEFTINDAPQLATCPDAAAWLAEHAATGPNAAHMQEEFAERCRQKAAAAFEKSQERLKRVRADLDQTKLKLIPDGAFGSSKDCLRRRACVWLGFYASQPRHLLGTLAMVVLLSLGAPFWYNALKQLTNLKPSITQKIEKETSTA